LTGRDRYTYQCTYGGFVAADKLKSTDDHVEIRRFYEPAPPDFDDKPVLRRVRRPSRGTTELDLHREPAAAVFDRSIRRGLTGP
jgi:hypothetical protein